MHDLIAKEDLGEVVWLRLNRAEKRNALTRGTLEQLSAALADVARNPRVRVLVLGACGPAFCAGMDLGEMQQRAGSADSSSEWARDSEVYCEVLSALFGLEIPTIAAVGGAAVAGGVGLVVACDFVVAAENAFFALPEPMRGITAAMVTPLLMHRVGAGAAGRLLLSGERWTAAQAFASGLCHDVVPHASLENRIGLLCETIRSGSREALAISKRHLAAMAGGRMPELLNQSIRVSAEARETADAREGLDAFLQKRKPRWQE